jgi:hypothetical protein
VHPIVELVQILELEHERILEECSYGIGNVGRRRNDAGDDVGVIVVQQLRFLAIERSWILVTSDQLEARSIGSQGRQAFDVAQGRRASTLRVS